MTVKEASLQNELDVANKLISHQNDEIKNLKTSDSISLITAILLLYVKYKKKYYQWLWSDIAADIELNLKNL